MLWRQFFYFSSLAGKEDFRTGTFSIFHKYALRCPQCHRNGCLLRPTRCQHHYCCRCHSLSIFPTWWFSTSVIDSWQATPRVTWPPSPHRPMTRGPMSPLADCTGEAAPTTGCSDCRCWSGRVCRCTDQAPSPPGAPCCSWTWSRQASLPLGAGTRRWRQSVSISSGELTGLGPAGDLVTSLCAHSHCGQCPRLRMADDLERSSASDSRAATARLPRWPRRSAWNQFRPQSFCFRFRWSDGAWPARPRPGWSRLLICSALVSGCRGYRYKA